MAKDNSLFVEFFGDYPIIRVLDFLVENNIFDYSKKDICRNASVSWNTLGIFWKQLEKKKIVVNTRKVGKAQMYKLNGNNPIVQKLLELDKKLVLDSLSNVPEPITKQKAKAFA